jgi:hypothetical protein
LIVGFSLTFAYCGSVLLDSLDGSNTLPGSSESDASKVAAPDCAAASRPLLDVIERGLTVSGGGSLRDGATVRSDDYEKVWFIAAEIDGVGIEDRGDVGIWATNSLTAGIGLIYAVDAVAQEFSDWGTSGDRFSIGDDGVSEARACQRSKD